LNLVANGVATLQLTNTGATINGSLTPSRLVLSASTDVSQGNIKFGRDNGQYIDFHGGAGGNRITSISPTVNAKGVYINATTDGANSAYSSGANFIELQLRGSQVARFSEGLTTFSDPVTVSGIITATGVTITNDWFRSTGNTGWYSQTYGGGWRMTDTSWVRVYGDKGIATGGALSIGGNATITGVVTANEFTGHDGSATDPSFTFTSDTDTGFYLSAAGNVKFTSWGTARCTFNSSGIEVGDYDTGTSGTSGTYVRTDGTITQQVHKDFTDTSNAYYLFRNTSNVFNIKGNGNVSNSNNIYGAISDLLLKENIEPTKSQWEDVKAYRLCNFNFIADQNKTRQLGVIAQELEATSPGLVQTGEDGLKTVAYSILVLKAVKALQEAMARIEVLEAAQSKGPKHDRHH